jgi:hypothetical protein
VRAVRRLERSMALGCFAVRTNLRSPMALGGLVACVVVATLGPLLSWTGGRGWLLEGDLLFYAYLVGGLFVLRSGVEQQREGGLQSYIRHNLATPVEHALGAVLALLGAWLLLTGLLFLMALLLSMGDVATAAWYAWTFGLGLGLFLPFTLMVESVSSFRIPLVLPLILYMALAVGLALTVGEARTAAILGISANRSDPASSLRLAARVALVAPLGFAVFVASVWIRAERPARGVMVPSGHGGAPNGGEPCPRADRTP